MVYPYIYTRGGWGLCCPMASLVPGHSAVHILPLECGGWHLGILMHMQYFQENIDIVRASELYTIIYLHDMTKMNLYDSA